MLLLCHGKIRKFGGVESATRLDSSELKGSAMKRRNEAGIWKYKQRRWSRDFKTAEIHSEAAERRRAEQTASLWSPANSDKSEPETLLLVIGDFPRSRTPPSWPDKYVHLLRPGVARQTLNVFYIFGFISRLQTWSVIGRSVPLLHLNESIKSDQPWR